MKRESIRISLIRSGLLAAATTVAMLAAGILAPAHAASDYLLELDGVKGESAQVSSDLDGKLAEAQALIATLGENFAQLEALEAEITSLTEQLDAVRKQGTEQHDYFATQMDDARKIFDEQVAPLLDSQVSDQVHAALAQAGERLMKAIAAGDAKLQAQLSTAEELSRKIHAVHNGIDDLGKVSFSDLSIMMDLSDKKGSK